MILASSKDGTQFRSTGSPTGVLVSPPLVDRFVGAAPLAVNQDEQLSITGLVTLEETVKSASSIAAHMLASAEVDAHAHPTNPDVLTNLALALANAGKPQHAVEVLEKVLKIDAKHYAALSILANFLAATKRPKEAEKVLHTGLRAFPNDERLSLGIANLAIQRGDFGLAEKMLKPSGKSGRGGVLCHYTLAVIYLSTNRASEAISCLREVTRTAVRLPQAHHALAVAYAMKGDLRRAIRSFRTALALAPEMRDSIHGLAVTYMRIGENANAVAVLKEYVPRHNDPEALELLADSYRGTKQYAKARRIYENLLYDLANANASIQARLLNSIGVCYALDHDFDRAQELFNGAIQLAERLEPHPHNNLARIYLATGKFPEMLEKAAATRVLFPADSDAELLHATALKKLERYDEALDEFQTIIAKGSIGAAAAYAEIGWILSDGRRDLASALEFLRAGYLKFPKHPIIANNLAYVHLSLGNPKEARAILEATPRTEETPILSATWGLLRFWEGDLKDGIRLYQEAEAYAREDRENELADSARQKMNLELARALVRQGQIEEAFKYVLIGLEARAGNKMFRNDLLSLKKELESQLK